MSYRYDAALVLKVEDYEKCKNLCGVSPKMHEMFLNPDEMLNDGICVVMKWGYLRASAKLKEFFDYIKTQMSEFYLVKMGENADDVEIVTKSADDMVRYASYVRDIKIQIPEKKHFLAYMPSERVRDAQMYVGNDFDHSHEVSEENLWLDACGSMILYDGMAYDEFAVRDELERQYPDINKWMYEIVEVHTLA